MTTNEELRAAYDNGDLAALIRRLPEPSRRAAVPVPGPLPDGVPTTQVSLRLPTDLLWHFDHLADGQHASRSDLIREAMVRYLYWRAGAANSAEVAHALDVLRGALLGLESSPPAHEAA